MSNDRVPEIENDQNDLDQNDHDSKIIIDIPNYSENNLKISSYLCSRLKKSRSYIYQIFVIRENHEADRT